MQPSLDPHTFYAGRPQKDPRAPFTTQPTLPNQCPHAGRLRNTRDGMVRETPPKRRQRAKDPAVRATAAPCFCGLRHDQPGEPRRLPHSPFVSGNSRYHRALKVGRGRKVGLLLCGEASVESGRHRGGAGPLREPELLE